MNRLIKNIVLTIGIGVLVFLIGNALSRGFEFDSFNDFLINFMFYQLYAFIIGFSNMYFFGYLGRLNWKEDESIKRIIIGILGSVIITLFGLFLLHMFEALVLENKSFETFIANESYRSYTFGLWITLTIVISCGLFLQTNSREKGQRISNCCPNTNS